MRASGVFTGTTNSPSRLPRQSLYHSTIRAGRNLPDKEFRYLRLIVNLHVAMQYGLYLLRSFPGVRHVVSEDSVNHFLQGSLSTLAFRNRVQRVCLLDNARHTLRCVMLLALHGFHDLAESVVDSSARREAHVASKKGNHFFRQRSP